MQKIYSLSVIFFSIAGILPLNAAPRKGQLTPAAKTAPAAVVENKVEVTAKTSEADAQAQEKKNWYDSIKISGMIRVRPESKQNFGFDNTQKYDFVGQKTWLTAEKTFSDKSKAVVTLQDVRIWGGQNPTNTDTGAELQAVDVREAYLLLKNFLFTPFDLQVGRQKIGYGDEVFIGVSDWGNTGRSFDGVRLYLNSDKNNLQIFSTLLQGGRSNDPMNPNSALANPLPNSGPGSKLNQYFSGIYDAWKIHPMFMLDTYFFARNQDNKITANQLYTGGVRISNRTEAGNAAPKDAI
ncbi:MAG TPA: alginate export family protein, partial [Turneriella sp.]|nr:alginate export family protein [Turneriella sp.]